MNDTDPSIAIYIVYSLYTLTYFFNFDMYESAVIMYTWVVGQLGDQNNTINSLSLNQRIFRFQH